MITCKHQLMLHTVTFTPAIMSKTVVPTRALLSTFSRSLRITRHQSLTTQCHQLSTSWPPTLPRIQCLRSATKCSIPIRHFSTSPPRTYKTVQEQRSRYRSGVRFPTATAARPSKLMQLAAVLLESRPPLPLFRRSTDLLFPI